MNNKAESTLRKYERILRVQRYSERTITVYSHYLNIFLNEFKQDPYHISIKETTSLLMEYDYSSASQQNQIIGSVRLFFKYIRGVKGFSLDIERPRKEKKLPNVLSELEIINAIKNCDNIKHKAMIAILFSTGMRRAELLNLKVKDIDSENMIIHIKQGKGFKDRKNPLKNNLLKILRSYYLEHKPKFFLFEGDKGGKYTSSSLYNVVRKHLNTNPHNIRHSRGTNIIDKGGDVTDVKAMLGHSSTKTSEVYVHTSINRLKQLHDPLERLSSPSLEAIYG